MGKKYIAMVDARRDTVALLDESDPRIMEKRVSHALATRTHEKGRRPSGAAYRVWIADGNRYAVFMDDSAMQLG